MVSIAAGLISVTEIGAPSFSSSMRSESVKAFTACLEAAYMPCSGTARSDSSLPRLMMAPPPRASCA
jgi:hypothetical protein